MAVDSRSKRASALTALRPYVLAPPLPDGDLATLVDREHMAWMYAGGLTVEEVSFVVLTVTDRSRAFYGVIDRSRSVYAVTDRSRPFYEVEDV